MPHLRTGCTSFVLLRSQKQFRKDVTINSLLALIKFRGRRRLHFYLFGNYRYRPCNWYEMLTQHLKLHCLRMSRFVILSKISVQYCWSVFNRLNLGSYVWLCMAWNANFYEITPYNRLWSTYMWPSSDFKWWSSWILRQKIKLSFFIDSEGTTDGNYGYFAHRTEQP